MSNQYREDSIIHLKGLDPVKKRPGMYIGNTALEGLHQLVYELVDNAVDEALAGYATHIRAELHKPENRIVVYDNGRGIPIGIHPKEKISTLELVLTRLHAGAKFDQKAYKTSGGLHGVGLSVVNALSEYLIAEVVRDKKRVIQKYERGFKVYEEEKTLDFQPQTYTKIEFVPDREIFESIEFEKERIIKRLEELSYLTPNVEFEFFYYEKGELKDEKRFLSKRGLLDFIENKLLNREDVLVLIEPYLIELKKDSSEFRAVIVATNLLEERYFSYVNNIRTIDGGSHVSTFKNALSRALRKFLEQQKKSFDQSVLDELKKFFQAVIDVRLPDPLFESQTKVKLKSSDVQKLFLSELTNQIFVYLSKNQKEVLDLIDRAHEASRLKLKLKQQLQKLKQKEKTTRLQLPFKLSDCTSKNVEERELFIVEGDSAGGSLKKSKDDRTQAVLPLRGKIRNVERADLESVLENQELLGLSQAIGLPLQRVIDQTTFEIKRFSDSEVSELLKNLRYSKIIIMTDADADGDHIRSLLLTFFYTYYRFLIEKGYVYIVQAPLYRIKLKNESYYAHDDQELEKVLNRLKLEGKSNFQVLRFKGLGEMNPQELYETCVDPKSRKLIQVKIEDFEDAEKTIRSLFGSDSEKRKQFLSQYQADISVLDLYE